MRFLFRRSINLFAVAAVFFSIACLFTVNAVFKGFDQELQKLFRGSLADVLIEWSWRSPPMDQVDELLKGYTYSPTMESFGILRSKRYVTAVTFKGVLPKAEQQLRKTMGMPELPLDELISSSTTSNAMGGLLGLFGESAGNEDMPVVVGDQLAERMGIDVGDRVTLMAPNWKENLGQRHFVVSSLFHTGYMEDDNSKVFIHLDEAQLLQNRPGGFSTIQVALTPSQNFDDLKEHVESQDERASVGTWKDRHRQRLAAIVHERKLIAIVLSMIVIVASFAILTIQWSFVKEKSKDIGILRAMGFSSSSIFCIFLGASWLVGFVGLILGLGGGALISTYANEIIAFTGWRPFPGELYYHQKLPVSIELSDAIWISALSLSVTTLAGLCPAWKATRLEPVAAIAHE